MQKIKRGFCGINNIKKLRSHPKICDRKAYTYNDLRLLKLIKTKISFLDNVLHQEKKSKKDLDTLLGKDALKTEFPQTSFMIVNTGISPFKNIFDRLNFLQLNN